jgi:hypothetical protein
MSGVATGAEIPAFAGMTASYKADTCGLRHFSNVIQASGLSAALKIHRFLSIPYRSASSACCSGGNAAVYVFQPGHQVMCHRQILPSIEFGLVSYFARKGHFSQFFPVIVLLRF